MIVGQLVFELRFRDVDGVVGHASCDMRAWNDRDDVLTTANRLLGNVFSQQVEITDC